MRKPGLSAKGKGSSASEKAPRQARVGSETEKLLIDIATPLFADMGFDRVTTRMIAQAADVTMPTIYLYFKDKRALYIRCCVEVFQRSTADTMRAMNHPGPPEERIFEMILSIIQSLRNDPYLAKLFQRELVDADHEGLQILDRDAFQGSFFLFQKTIDEALQRPQPPLTAISVYALAFGLQLYSQVDGEAAEELNPEQVSSDQLAHHVMRTTLPEIYGKYLKLKA